MSIYTRTGDDGTTAFFGGKRVLKCEELVDVYGSLDELNSWVGLISSQIKDKGLRSFLSLIQSDLFTIGSVLAGWKGNLTNVGKRVPKMEQRIDAMEKTLPKLRNFILPGGSPSGARIHVARGICRRVERQAVALSRKQSVDSVILKYLNRLSDLFFVLARYINQKDGYKETVWIGIKRK
jgi:cob(I)alamin adenosyltransferase